MPPVASGAGGRRGVGGGEAEGKGARLAVAQVQPLQPATGPASIWTQEGRHFWDPL